MKNTTQILKVRNKIIFCFKLKCVRDCNENPLHPFSDAKIEMESPAHRARPNYLTKSNPNNSSKEKLTSTFHH